MISSMDAARFIINYSNQKKYHLSCRKLQCLLYFVQAYYLSSFTWHKPCFAEEIEADRYGPVIPSVDDAFRRYGGNNIPSIHFYYSLKDKNNPWSIEKIEFSDTDIPKKDRKRITKVVDTFGSFGTLELQKICTSQLPCIMAAKSNQKVITLESVKRYFS